MKGKAELLEGSQRGGNGKAHPLALAWGTLPVGACYSRLSVSIKDVSLVPHLDQGQTTQLEHYVLPATPLEVGSSRRLDL